MSHPSITDSSVIDLISSFVGSIDDINPSTADLHQDVATDSPVSGPKPSVHYISSVRVIIFSKDRPWQLQQLLRSMQLPADDGCWKSNSISRVDIIIIIHASRHEFYVGYETAIQSFLRDSSEMLNIKFCFEEEDKIRNEVFTDDSYSNSFSKLLQSALIDDLEPEAAEPSSNASEKPQDMVMFLTDDCLLLEPLETILYYAIRSLADESDGVFNFVSRLHPGISWSQTRDVPSPPPRNMFSYQSIDSSEGVYFYYRESASVEWNYPFDLSGGVYRRSDVLSILNNIAQDGTSHPNLFELRCNEALESTLASKNQSKPITAIPTRPLLVILAVNRVQDVCKAPLASSASSRQDLSVDPSNAFDLLKLLDCEQIFDVEQYKTTLYNSSHIGDFFLHRDNNELSESLSLHNELPKLSVLIPVHNGPPEAASHAITSIIMQPFGEIDRALILNTDGTSDILPIQIVLVDDRCTDGSIDAMVNAAEILTSRLQISLHIRDLRADNETTCSHIQMLTSSVDIVIDVVASPQPGVASALNHGLKYCECEIVARMDADDVAAPNRLLSQLRFMQANQSFGVVGASTILFTVDDNNKRAKQLLPYIDTCHDIGIKTVEKCNAFQTSLFISDPGFLAWSMLFSCTIQHPSVLFRKSAIQEIGGYDEAIKSCEDYDLWLRLTQNNGHIMTNLPNIGLWHRKHEKSKSAIESSNQKSEANVVSYNAITRLFDSWGGKCNVLTVENVSALRNPSIVESRDDADTAAFLLETIEHVFVKSNSQWLAHRCQGLIKSDVDNRIAELAVKFPNKSMAWSIWTKRCPDKQLERLSLTVNSNVSDNAKKQSRAGNK